MINPENNAMAITGEKPDQSRLGPKKNLVLVVNTTRIVVKIIWLRLIFIIILLNEAQK